VTDSTGVGPLPGSRSKWNAARATTSRSWRASFRPASKRKLCEELAAEEEEHVAMLETELEQLALNASTPPAARNSPSAIWLRAELPVQRTSIRVLVIVRLLRAGSRRRTTSG
jgi:hypothetical protein